ncbi:primase C-terminal domain-containing protein [Enterococcus faecalis]|uniref:primase C-terminal domain-containing protein n=1 Tax=Enterococcus faecalis TaxID=1351 RepID=UPI003D0B78B5
MIYVGKVIPSLMNEPTNRNILDFLVEYTPQKVTVSSDEEQQKKLKTRILNGFISGEMSALIRKNENLVSRDCLILDLDDVIVSASELKEEIHREFKQFDYALFPSVSNGIKGVRYRLVLPVDRSVQSQEYSLIVRFFNERILQNVLNVPDESNATWSQIQLLPVLTQYNHQEDILIHRTGKQLPVGALLEGARTFFKGKRAQSETKTPKNAYVKANSYLNNMLVEIFKGCGEGNRNNRIKDLTVKFTKQGVKPTVMLEVAKVANAYFTPPLNEKEVEQTVKSVVMTMLGVRPNDR